MLTKIGGQFRVQDYFIKDNHLTIITNVKPNFNILKRYIGTEPNCEVTNTYNETIKEILPKYNVGVFIIDRKEVESGVISASRVRSLLKKGELNSVKSLVPKTTLDFLLSEEGGEVISKL